MKNIVHALAFAASIVAIPAIAAAQKYDLLIQGGHLIDSRNGIHGVRDVAIAAGKIAAIASTIDSAAAAKNTKNEYRDRDETNGA